jgi:hypothetical protein
MLKLPPHNFTHSPTQAKDKGRAYEDADEEEQNIFSNDGFAEAGAAEDTATLPGFGGATFELELQVYDGSEASEEGGDAAAAAEPPPPEPLVDTSAPSQRRAVAMTSVPIVHMDMGLGGSASSGLGA